MDIITREYHIYGLVQGVGFRPFVCDWANAHGLAGYVKNDGGIVTVLLSGPADTIEEFCELMLSLDGRSPVLPGAIVERLEPVGCSPVTPSDMFKIIESSDGSDELRMLPPDIATCPSCVAELFDPANRRYRHPFISCTACGPRYTIMTDVPYDRERTTMDSFPMCLSCKDEYEDGREKNCSDKETRFSVFRSGQFSTARPTRHYAQTICCNECGPKLFAYDGRDEADGEEAFAWAVEVLRDGGIVAVKDVGGYHLCYDALNMETEERLREWKNRERKPFAIMFRDMDEIRKYAHVSKTEEQLLTSSVAPIVLLNPINEDGRIGAFLPSNPLQHMLLRELSPLVMTSGNRGGEPIITRDEDMKALLKTGVPDLMLYNDRDILYGLDDSIYQVISISSEDVSESCVHEADRFSDLRWTHDHDHPGGGEKSDEIVQVIRRARGLVPSPIWIDRELATDTFAAGGDLKSVFALGRKNAVYMSGHFGDLDEVRCMDARGESIAHMENLLGIHPETYICDKHPLYNSVLDTKARANILGGSFQIQHHFAHTMSVAAEHGLTGSVLGVAFDGTGYGDDGTIWGGEFLLCDADEMTYTRVGHLKSVPIIGGDESARDAKKTAFCFLAAGRFEGSSADRTSVDEISEALQLSPTEGNLLKGALDKNINTVKNSSMGRLFDAATAILGIAYENSYEGECPIALQYAAERFVEGRTESSTEDRAESLIDDPTLDFPIYEEEGMFIANTQILLNDLYEKKQAGIPADTLAYAFHKAVADMTAKMCALIQKNGDIGPTTVSLSGGTMQNALLLKLLIPKLRKLKTEVYLNHQVPPGDGGLALGQIVCKNTDKCDRIDG